MLFGFLYVNLQSPWNISCRAPACFIEPVLITFIILLWKVYWSHVISIFRKTARIWIQSSLSYGENKTVVKRDPCGAPCANKALFWHNVDPLKQTLCAQLNRKSLIQTKRHRLTPRSFTLFSKMSVFIQLKEEVKLKNKVLPDTKRLWRLLFTRLSVVKTASTLSLMSCGLIFSHSGNEMIGFSFLVSPTK